MNFDAAIDKFNTNTNLLQNFYVELPNSIENVKYFVFKFSL
jgi:hypothetical protein